MIYNYSTHNEPKEFELNSMTNQNFDNINFERCILTNLNMDKSTFITVTFVQLK